MKERGRWWCGQEKNNGGKWRPNAEIIERIRKENEEGFVSDRGYNSKDLVFKVECMEIWVKVKLPKIFLLENYLESVWYLI